MLALPFIKGTFMLNLNSVFLFTFILSNCHGLLTVQVYTLTQFFQNHASVVHLVHQFNNSHTISSSCHT